MHELSISDKIVMLLDTTTRWWSEYDLEKHLDAPSASRRLREIISPYRDLEGNLRHDSPYEERWVANKKGRGHHREFRKRRMDGNQMPLLELGGYQVVGSWRGRPYVGKNPQPMRK